MNFWGPQEDPILHTHTLTILKIGMLGRLIVKALIENLLSGRLGKNCRIDLLILNLYRKAHSS